MLMTEIIGLQTLLKWIEKNTFGLNSKEKYDWLEKVLTKSDKILFLVDQKKKLSFKDLRSVLGMSDKL